MTETFKETSMGPVPQDWELIQLKNYLKTKSYNGIYKSKEFQGKGVKLIKMDTLFDNYYINNQKMELLDLTDAEKQKFLVEDGDLIFARTSLVLEGVGKCALVENINNKTAFESNTFRIKLNDKINPKYILYFFRSEYGKQLIYGIANQTAATSIRSSDIANLTIPVPNLDEQNRIVYLLFSLEKKIQLNNQMNQTLEQIAQTIFKQWFVHFEFPNEEGKPYKSSGGEMVDSELGEIPNGWEVGELEDVLFTLESGTRPKGGIKELAEGVPSIGAENISGLGKFDYSKNKLVELSFFEKMKSGIVKSKDVLLYKDGAHIGRKSLFMNNFPFSKCCVNEHIFILRTKPNLSPFYLYFWLDQSWMTEEIKNLNANSAQPGINKKGVNSLIIIIPEKDVIKRFNDLIESLMSKIFQNALENKNLANIIDSILPKLMSGKIRVPLEDK